MYSNGCTRGIMPRAAIDRAAKIFCFICCKRYLQLQFRVQLSNSTMQDIGKNKIPANLLSYLDQLELTKQVTCFFTFLRLSNQLSYVIDISLSKPKSLPFIIGGALEKQQLKTVQQVLSKENRAEIMGKYIACSIDEVNQIVQKYMVINISMQGYKGVSLELIGFNLEYASKQKLIKQKYPVSKFPDLIQFCAQNCRHTWNQYSLKYWRALNQKKLKNNNQISIGLFPFIQFCVSTILTTKHGSNFVPKIEQSSSFSSIYSFLFSLSTQTNKENLITSIKEFIIQKLHQNQTTNAINDSISIFYSYKSTPRKIFNPHLFATFPKKEKFQLILVKGTYEYYHYGDQGFNDHGWGCAYRALQTLMSWLIIQGHTDTLKQMMSINKIQETLDIFDRSRKLKGSSTWIGATQISWIVPSITKNSLNCKILYVSDGKKVLQKCEEFKNHFLTSGCPIMYGGGEYAYSIVGMYYNWKLGQCQFLILDPHYTGEDEYGKIIEKKGIVWRKPDQMFKKGVFYNFCLPIIC